MNKVRRKNTENRARLIEAASFVFTEKGFTDASIRDIAARAQMTSGLVYYYFKTKDEILLAVQAAMQQKYQEKYQMPDDIAYTDALNEVKNRIRENPEWYQWRYELYALSFRRDDMRAQVELLLEEGRQSLVTHLTNSLSGRDAQALSSLLLACFDGFALQKIASDSFDIDQAYELLSEVIDAYIKSRGGVNA